MAFPTTSVLDTLQGGSLSGNWTTPSLGSPGTVTEDASGAFTSTVATGGLYWNPGMFGADQEVYGTYTTATNLIALLARITNPGTTVAASLNAYQCNVAAGGSWALYKWVAGTATQINGSTFGALSNGDKMGLEAIGTTISFYTKRGAGAWTLVAATTDSAVSGAGYIGYLTGNNAVRLSSAGGGTIAGATVNSGFLAIL